MRQDTTDYYRGFDAGRWALGYDGRYHQHSVYWLGYQIGQSRRRESLGHRLYPGY